MPAPAAARPAGGSQALPVLVSRVLGALAAEVSADADGQLAPLPLWSNVLRCIGDGLTETALATEARLSKRMAIAAATGATRRGWLHADGGTRGRRSLTLSTSGRSCLAEWDDRLSTLDAQWASSALRNALEGIVAGLPFELPWFPASYGTADPSVVGGSFVPPNPETGEPAHGQDWQPVLRDRSAALTGLPITALLAQVLGAFAMDYEARPSWPLASTTLVVQHLPSEPAPLADVPPGHGIAGNGRSLLERHLLAEVTADPADPRRQLVALTARGRRVKAMHQFGLDAVEQAWRDRHGDDRVTALRAALTDHPASSDPAWPDHVVSVLHR